MTPRLNICNLKIFIDPRYKGVRTLKRKMEDNSTFDYYVASTSSNRVDLFFTLHLNQRSRRNAAHDSINDTLTTPALRHNYQLNHNPQLNTITLLLPRPRLLGVRGAGQMLVLLLMHLCQKKCGSERGWSVRPHQNGVFAILFRPPRRRR